MTAIPLALRETAVYRLFDVNKVLLYVGCTCTGDVRIGQHRGKPWWPDVDDITVAWYPDRPTALKHEAIAIATESPLYNVQKPNPAKARTAPARVSSADSGLTFEQVAAEIDVPELWLRAGVMRSELPHSCNDPDGDDVWFSPEDIAELHVIYDYGFGSGSNRSQRSSIRRRYRLGHCTHCVI